MKNIEYREFGDISAASMASLLNEDSLRTHLIDHPYFDAETVQAWMTEKEEVDSQATCRVRAVLVGGELAGWCGIQPDEVGVELAVVISQRYWGVGVAVFKDMLSWARELGHSQIRFHLLDSRKAYRSLESMASEVIQSQMLGRTFTTYNIPVN